LCLLTTHLFYLNYRLDDRFDQIVAKR
jgi:hypothetical protein